MGDRQQIQHQRFQRVTARLESGVVGLGGTRIAGFVRHELFSCVWPQGEKAESRAGVSPSATTSNTGAAA